MAEHTEESTPVEESFMDGIAEKFHSHGSSSSESDDEKLEAAPSSIKEKVWRFFGRERPVHDVFGGGKRMRSLHSTPCLYRRATFDSCSSAFFFSVYDQFLPSAVLSNFYFLDGSG